MKTTGHSVAVLFADVAGSTRLYEVFGDTKAKLLVDECLDAMRGVIASHGGYVVKTIGDEIMCVMPGAEMGWKTAVDIQLKISDLPEVEGHQRAVRVGFHAGFVIKTNNDVFGDTVNVAARMTGLAKGGQIMTTMATVLLLPKLLRSSTRKIAALSIKGKSKDVQVCEVIWQTNDELTMRLPSRILFPRHVQLNLSYGDDACQMSLECPRIEIGRDAACRFVVGNKMASRQHAIIELRQEKYFLTDQSTNGTYVLIDGEAQFALRREEIMLQGTGSISIGRGFDEALDDVIRFELVESS